MTKMTQQEVEEFIKTQEKWNQLNFVEKVWDEIHKNIKRKCINCQNYAICLQENKTKEKACTDWFLSHRVFEGIIEKYRKKMKEKGE